MTLLFYKYNYNLQNINMDMELDMQHEQGSLTDTTTETQKEEQGLDQPFKAAQRGAFDNSLCIEKRKKKSYLCKE